MSKNPLRSRKFWYAVGTIAADIAITQIPELESVRKELMTVVSGLGLALILAVAGEDMAYWLHRK